ncbi:MAG: ABC transporter permease subunit [Chloroflexi bacterium]|nr:ABC transporter permease subunit [Chloroflexota bacterium]
MTDITQFDEAREQTPATGRSGTVLRVAKFALLKILSLLLALAIGLYLAILVANLGGFIDNIYKGIVLDSMRGIALSGEFKDIPAEQREAALAGIQWQMEDGYGLHEPFLLRTLVLFSHSIVFDLGEARYAYDFVTQKEVKTLVAETLPYTLLLTGSANVLVFVTSVLLALGISRKYGGFLDRLVIALSPLSSAPSWIIGIVLIIVFAAGLHILPFPRQVDILQASNWVAYVPYLLEYMALPFAAIFLGAFFQSVYAWRTYFLIYSDEEYVEMAKAKGLPSHRIERIHILKPALPYLVASFALTMIGLWQGSIALETLFYWQGIGSLFVQATRRFDVQLIVGIMVVFAYLLALTALLLDVIYAMLDPRVRVEGQGFGLRTRRKKRGQAGVPGRDRPGSGPRKTRAAQLSPAERNALRKERRVFHRMFTSVKPILQEIARYPSAIAGVVIIIILAGVSIYTVFAIPYDEAIAAWRREEKEFIENPRIVPPEWVNLFRRDDLPATLVMDSEAGDGARSVETISSDMTRITTTFSFEYDYKAFPRDLALFFEPVYVEKLPLVTATWTRPDGRSIAIFQQSFTHSDNSYYLSQDKSLARKLGDEPLEDGLFDDGDLDDLSPIPGVYELRLDCYVFEPGSTVEAEMALYGRVHGLAGTDHQRRDLTVALLWGMPVALAFGALGAALTSLLSMLIAAVGAWYGGWVDNLVQRVTDINMILPTLPVVIMVSILYTRSIWAILGVVALLNIFGSSVKNFRAAFLQMREAPYVEAARSYGVGNWRIITRYLAPRILPALIPQLVIMVPGYVFYEATLAYLGLSDPALPTWGKVIYDALTIGAYQGNYYWLLEPVGLLLLAGLAFAMLGFALDRIFNPRLRME